MRHLQPLRAAVTHLPGVVVALDVARRITYGQAVEIEPEGDGEVCCAYDPEHQLLAILRHDPASGLWRPRKVFADQ